MSVTVSFATNFIDEETSAYKLDPYDHLVIGNFFMLPNNTDVARGKSYVLRNIHPANGITLIMNDQRMITKENTGVIKGCFKTPKNMCSIVKIDTNEWVEM